MQPVRFSAFEERDAQGYAAFARAQFGASAYQASGRYLDWLYHRNPNARGYRDFLLARTPEGRIVGCIHKLILPWRVDGRIQPLPTLHNLMIEPEYRKGTGLFLLMAAVRGEDHAVIPGVVGDLSEAYRRMRGYQPVPSWWYRTALSRPRAALHYALHRLGLGRGARWLPADLDRGMLGCRVRARPGAEAVARITRQLNGDGEGCRALWSDALVEWRFFSPSGPRHALVESDNGDSFAVVSLGPRHGVPVSRLVAWSMGPDARGFLARLRSIAAGLGAHLLMALSAREPDREALDRAGWKPMGDAPDSYLYSKARDEHPVSFSAAPTDYGFEALPG